MRRVGLAGLACALLAGCLPGPPVVVNPDDGFTHIARGGTFDCQGQPIAVDAMHKDVVLRNDCRRVWIAGSHDDVIVYVDPGASIEVTGVGDSVVYRLLRRGAAPKWSDRGQDNELLRNSLASWEQDHDWYLEQH